MVMRTFSCVAMEITIPLRGDSASLRARESQEAPEEQALLDQRETQVAGSALKTAKSHLSDLTTSRPDKIALVTIRVGVVTRCLHLLLRAPFAFYAAICG